MNKGFTLVELLVSIAIFSIVTALVLAKYQSFNGGIILTNTAYEIALAIRQAQSYGINVRGQMSGSATTFDSSYGIHFDDTRTFSLFADLHTAFFDPVTLMSNGDGRYDGTSAELVDTYKIGKGITIQSVCGYQRSSGAKVCYTNPPDVLNDIRAVDVTFDRPEPEANFALTTGSASACYSNIGSNNRCISGGVDYLEVVIVSTDKKSKKAIVVEHTGQISIKNAN